MQPPDPLLPNHFLQLQKMIIDRDVELRGELILHDARVTTLSADCGRKAGYTGEYFNHPFLTKVRLRQTCSTDNGGDIRRDIKVDIIIRLRDQIKKAIQVALFKPPTLQCFKLLLKLRNRVPLFLKQTMMLMRSL